ncbi:hypothetical protein C0992_004378 [Termitomyces sp. T32_za158]|nr:hypothetical protein C0992_004378 [Termitomyces sp. T32_za158]
MQGVSSSMACVSQVFRESTKKIIIEELPQPDIFISHDWPNTIEQHGNVQELIKNKDYLKSDIESGQLGSPPFMNLLKTLRPKRWFAAHMHTRFEAEVVHNHAVERAKPAEITIEDDSFHEEAPKETIPTVSTREAEKPVSGAPSTKFLALDKCRPRRKFLEVLDIPSPAFDTVKQFIRRPKPEISFDPHWLAITRAFQPMFSVGEEQDPLPDEYEARASVERELQWVYEHIPKKLNGRWAVKDCQKFVRTAFTVSPERSGRMMPGTPARECSSHINPEISLMLGLEYQPWRTQIRKRRRFVIC